MCRPAGSLTQWTASGDTGRVGGTVHAPAAAALKPVLADVTVPGTRHGDSWCCLCHYIDCLETCFLDLNSAVLSCRDSTAAVKKKIISY